MREPLLIMMLYASGASAPFADRVEPSWYRPAPGQFVNDPLFNDPTRALGAPSGGGTNQPDNTSLCSLGGFGGSLILGFSERVLDDPRNPMGLDAIVFGNAFYIASDPTRRWAESAIIEISLDTNGNAQPDDAWYVVRAPALPEVPEVARHTVLWDDLPSTTTPPLNLAWYPDSVMQQSFSTTGFRLHGALASVSLTNSDPDLEDHYALADLTPTLLLGDTDADNTIDDPSATPSAFFTRPDSPFLVGIDPGSAGGDAFDIAWAVDPLTGAPADLPGFDFIRLSTGPDALAGLFGEISSEIDAVADVAPDPAWFDINDDGVTDIEDLYSFTAAPADLNRDARTDALDQDLLIACLRAGELESMTAGGGR